MCLYTYSSSHTSYTVHIVHRIVNSLAMATLLHWNSIGRLNGQKSLDRIIALQLITSIGACLIRTFLFGQHVTQLDHTPIGSSIATWVFKICCVHVYFPVSSCEVSFMFLYPLIFGSFTFTFTF